MTVYFNFGWNCMFGNNRDVRAKLAAIDGAYATIAFKLDGTILDANENFLAAMKYSKKEIIGKHHSIFVRHEERDSAEYKAFWDSLNDGQSQVAEFHRIAKDGSDIWIQACYAPLLDGNGKPYKVIKLASDITAEKLKNADNLGQISAINKSQAVISFSLDGVILDANENFLAATKYRADEVRGHHHRMFVSPELGASAEYQNFWDSLKNGQYQAGEYCRYDKNGNEVWIQASYNPILDMKGQPFKVVKFATDITDQIMERRRRAEVQQQIDGALQGILSAMEQTTQKTNEVSGASESAAQNVQSIASGTEELSSSVAEISQQVSTALDISVEAVEQANHTNHIVSGLAEAGSKIGEVIELINSIAEKTNLLALNATIEAARAGEAGKGFAVVASEVKELATQTSKATDEIASQIEAVQTTTEKAVSALDVITNTIGRINEISNSISTSVGQQESVTNEISSNMLEAARGVEIINKSINEIASSAEIANSATREVAEASRAVG